MTYDPNVIYDPTDGEYRDEYAVRTEISRVFDLCLSCRRCETLCETFVSFFDVAGRKAVTEAGLLTPADQDRMMNLCILCGLCAERCPYAVTGSPAHESINDLNGAPIDLVQLATRHRAMLRHNGLIPWRTRLAEIWHRRRLRG